MIQYIVLMVLVAAIFGMEVYRLTKEAKKESQPDGPMYLTFRTDDRIVLWHGQDLPMSTLNVLKKNLSESGLKVVAISGIPLPDGIIHVKGKLE